jgi:2-dehydropantoate 2-reductase
MLAPDIEVKIWKKLIVNCCLNTVCAIVGKRVGAVAEVPAIWPLLDGVVDEIVAIANRKHIDLNGAEARAFLRNVAEEAREHEPSMLIDVRHGRATEIDCLNGAILRECERLEIPAPHNRSLYAMIRAIEETADRRSR